MEVRRTDVLIYGLQDYPDIWVWTRKYILCTLIASSVKRESSHVLVVRLKRDESKRVGGLGIPHFIVLHRWCRFFTKWRQELLPARRLQLTFFAVFVAVSLIFANAIISYHWGSLDPNPHYLQGMPVLERALQMETITTDNNYPIIWLIWALITFGLWPKQLLFIAKSVPSWGWRWLAVSSWCHVAEPPQVNEALFPKLLALYFLSPDGW